MREQQCLLGEQSHTAGMRWDEDPGGGIGENGVAEDYSAGIGRQEPGDQREQRRLTGAIGAQDRQDVTACQLEGEVGVTFGHLRVQFQPAHNGPVSRREAEAITMVAATRISRSDRATAASGSVSR